ncbi:MAG: multiheme c-type cytochrome [Pirellulales bacterium]
MTVRRPAKGRLSPARRLCLVCLSLACVALALRAGQLALRDAHVAESLRDSELPVSEKLAHVRAIAPSPQPPVPKPQSLRDLHAELARVCPVIADMPAQEFVERGQGPGVGGQGNSKTAPEPWEADWYGGPAIRTVAATTSAQTSSKKWLVPPEKWFLPGDEAKLNQTAPAAPEPENEAPVAAPSQGLPAVESQPAEQSPSQALPDEPPLEALPIEPPSKALPPSAVGMENVDVGDRRSPATAEELPRSEVFAPPSLPLMPHGRGSDPLPLGGREQAVDPHLELFAKNCYPSARQCGECHKKIYEEWAVSSHAYAMVSPMFHKFEQKINDISQGTVGYFCLRCHAPVAVAMCQSRDTPIWDMPEVAREGITCIACHRVQYRYGKTNGERRIEPGDIYAPVMGSIGGDGVAKAIAEKDNFKVKTSPDDKGPGQAIHLEGIYFDQLSKPEYCSSCHQVAVHPGIKLEVVWEQYRKSPACKKGISCQDCHMGRVPGIPSGYEVCSIAEVGGKSVNEHRKHANHIFYGPGYSIAHPGIFPFHKDGNRWTIQEWLLFDWRGGWGTDDFEDAVADGKINVAFPPAWAEADDRYDAREIIDDNQKRLTAKTDIRRTVMENGTHVEGPFFKRDPCAGTDLHFHYVVTNKNEGHNILTASLGAQPQLWANVALIGPNGQRLWETGYTDAYGDLADIHSEGVRQKHVPYDWQLFNLQTMFLITGAVGTDREFPLPVNVDIDQLPFLRPGTLPISVLNHPPFIRMESRSLAPLGSRRATYKVPGHLLTQPGPYRLTFRLRSRNEPIYFMRFCEATVEMQRAMNEGVIDVHPCSVEFFVR